MFWNRCFTTITFGKTKLVHSYEFLTILGFAVISQDLQWVRGWFLNLIILFQVPKIINSLDRDFGTNRSLEMQIYRIPLFDIYLKFWERSVSRISCSAAWAFEEFQWFGLSFSGSQFNKKEKDVRVKKQVEGTPFDPRISITSQILINFSRCALNH